MNKAEFLQTGGFPFETNTLDFMQNTYTLFNAFGHLAGATVIVSGCETIGARTNDGVVFYNGELLKFVGGVNQSTVVVKETVSSAIFEDGDTKDVYKERYITFGTGTAQIAWSSFTGIESLTSLKTMIDNLQPHFKEVSHVTVSVTNADLRPGWFIANGENGTNNLLGKAIFGYDPTDDDFKVVGASGGDKSKNIYLANLPKVTMTATTSTDSHNHTVNNVWHGRKVEIEDGNGANIADDGFTNKTTSTDSHNHTVTMVLNGGGEKLVILPPHIVAIPIQYIGI